MRVTITVARMKFLPSQLAYLMQDPEARTNIRSLLKYVAFLAALVLPTRCCSTSSSCSWKASAIRRPPARTGPSW
ncbi:MAG TPA: hypothetical protein VE505_16360 [Vicinamibacterales bacterium]|nr:hypothetical protein [Vicinamibacterales bacterium]